MNRVDSLGKFSIESGNVIITDPCYDMDVWCVGKLNNVKKGEYEAFAVYVEDERWGVRVSELIIIHADHAELTLENRGENLGFDIGVDGGSAGFFDMAHYGDDSVVPADQEYDINFKPERGGRWTKWACMVCAAVFTKAYRENERNWSYWNNAHIFWTTDQVGGLFPEITIEEVQRRAKEKIKELKQWDAQAGVFPFGVCSHSGYGDGSYNAYGVKDDNGEYVKLSVVFIGDSEEEDDDEI